MRVSIRVMLRMNWELRSEQSIFLVTGEFSYKNYSRQLKSYVSCQLYCRCIVSNKISCENINLKY